MQIKVISWNIWIEGNFKQVAEFLKQSEADIIGLQEVQEDIPDRNISEFLSVLGYDYIFAPAQKEWGGKIWNDGPAVFSKYPIINKQRHFLSSENVRAAAQADIRIGDKILHVFSTHLVHTHQQPSMLQEDQGKVLLSKLTNEKTLLMGDFNATPDSAVIRNASKALIDTDPSSAPTWSVYPEGCLTCNPQRIETRLDYIFVTPDLKAHDFRVEQSKASDHLPISILLEV